MEAAEQPTDDDVIGSASANDQVSAHLDALKGRHRVKAHTTGRVRDAVTVALYGPTRNDDAEVGDDFFNPQLPSDRGVVRLHIARAQAQAGKGARRIGKLVGRGASAEERRRARAKVPAALVEGERLEVVDDEAGPSATAARSPTFTSISLARSGSASTFASTSSEVSLKPLSELEPAASRLATPRRFPFLKLSTSLQPSSSTSSSSSSHHDKSKPHRPKPPPRHRRQVQARLAKSRRVARALGEEGEGEERLVAALMEADALENEEEKHVMDVLYEHQRGFVMFGLPHFSSAALAQFDPAPWTDEHLRDSPYTPRDHPLPTPFWHWDHSHWLVDMGRDTDEHGWAYALRFHSSHWRGEADGWRSFVRRRRWIRGRVFRPIKLLDPLDGTAGAGTAVDWEALRNSVFADRRTPEDGSKVDTSREVGPLPPSHAGVLGVGLKSATALLPLSPERKDDVFGWEQAMDARDPFLAYDYIKREGAEVLARRRERDAPGTRSDEELFGVWRDAVVEINYRRTARVLRLCRLDREKLGVWRWWFGVEARPDREQSQGGDFASSADVFAAPNASPLVGLNAIVGLDALGGSDAIGLADKAKRPTLEDVWDLVEGRLDEILKLFEFQSTRLDFLRLVLSLHSSTHPHHRYTSEDRGHPYEPAVLEPLGRVGFYSDVKILLQYFDGKELDARRQSEEAEALRKRIGSAKGKGKGKA